MTPTARKLILFKGVGGYLSLNFMLSRFRLRGAQYANFLDIPGATFTRATVGYGATVAGNLTAFVSGSPRITDAGFTVEAAATNLDPNSLTIGGTGWTTNAAPTITQNFAAAPDGTTTAVRVQSTASNSGPWRGSVSLATATAYTRSLWLKDNGGSVKTVQLGVGQAVFGGAGGDRNATFNVATGVLSGIDAAYTATSVRAGANGWWRVSLTFTTTSASANANFTIYGTASGADFLVWDHDPEAGTYPTTDITTAGAAATRNADVAGQTVNIPVGQPFTVIWKGIVPPQTSVAARGFDLVDNVSPVNRLNLYFLSGSVNMGSMANSVGSSAPSTAVTPGAVLNVAVSVIGTSLSVSFNGGAVQTATLSVPFTNILSILAIGRRASGDLQLNSIIRELSIELRGYSAAQLQQASA